jgi:hypothetical protein
MEGINGTYKGATLFIEDILRLFPLCEKRRAGGTRIYGLRLKKKVTYKGAVVSSVEDLSDI